VGVVTLKQWLRGLWGGMWFIPAMMTLGSVALAVVLSGIAGWMPLKPGDSPHFQAAAARGVLTTLASASITVAALVLSITMVVLSSASSQFGPRLLPNFIGRTGPKLAVGGFMASFAYQVVVASAATPEHPVSDLAVWVGVIGSLASFVILLAFIQMVARYIQAPLIVDDVTADLCRSLAAFMDSDSRGADPDSARLDPTWAERSRIHSRRSGYVQEIDIGCLRRIATSAGGCLRCEVRAGTFVAKGDLLAVFLGPQGDELEAGPAEAGFGFGPRRTAQQDVEFAIRQLVEVAARALSPGVNDPYTAINVIERIGGAFREVADRPVPRGLWHDDEGVPRLMLPVPDATALVDGAYLPLRQHARSSEAVAIALMDSYRVMASRPLHPDFAVALRRHADLLLADGEETFLSEFDREALRRRHGRVIEALGRTD